MKLQHIITIFFLSLFPITGTFGQNSVDTVFLDEDWRVVEAGNAWLKGIRTYDDNGKGKGMYYLMSGELMYEYHEVSGKRHGLCKSYHENGELDRVGHYKKDKPVGEHNFYDVSGVYIRTDIYNNRHKIKAAYYNVEGKKVFTECRRLSSFGNYWNENKAFVKMGHFIDAELVRPPIAEDYAESVVLASFLIAPDGSLENIRIDMSVHPALDQAVIDVIQKMPRWKPAKHKREAVYSEFSVAVSF